MFKRILVSIAFASLLAGCLGGGDEAPTAETPPVVAPVPVVPPVPVAFQELAFVADQGTVATVSTVGTASTVLSTVTVAGIPGTYSRSGNNVTVVIPNHDLRDGLRVGLDFKAGTGGTATSGNYIVNRVDKDTFTVQDFAAGTITNGTLTKQFINTFTANYSQTSTTITVTMTHHTLVAGDTVELKILSGGATSGNFRVNAVIDTDTFTVVAQTAASATGTLNISLGTNYIATDAVMHPNGKWLYVSSTYDCSNGDPYCWGGDLISQYSIDWFSGKLTFLASVRTSTDTVQASPVKMVINPAGTKLVHQDDQLDGVRLWTIDATTGNLTQVGNSGSSTTHQHGLAFSTDGAYVYHGDTVFAVTSTIARITTGSNASSETLLVNGKVYSVSAGDKLSVFSLTTPTSLTLTASIDTSTTTHARDIAVSKNGSLILTAGYGGLKSYSFNGTTLTAAVSASPTQVIDGGGSVWPGGSASVRVYRGVSLNDAGNVAIAAYFTTNQPGAAQGGLPPSGYVVLSFGSDGALTLLSDQNVAQYARVAKFLKNPG